MKYLLLIYTDSQDNTRQAEIAQQQTLRQSDSPIGVLLSHATLLPTSAASTLKMQAGKAKISPGPVTNTPEQLCGFYLINCSDLDEAAAWATQVLGPHIDAIEIRPVF